MSSPLSYLSPSNRRSPAILAKSPRICKLLFDPLDIRTLVRYHPRTHVRHWDLDPTSAFQTPGLAAGRLAARSAGASGRAGEPGAGAGGDGRHGAGPEHGGRPAGR